MKQWIWNILIGLDQMANVIFSPILNWTLKPDYKFGYPDETLSSVFGKNTRSGNCKFCYYVCRCLHWFDEGHCAKNIEEDEGN